MIGAPFYLMEHVEGVVVRDTLPGWLDEPRRHALGLDLAAAFAEVHRVDVEPFVDGRPRPAERLPGPAAAPVDRAAGGHPGRRRRGRWDRPATCPTTTWSATGWPRTCPTRPSRRSCTATTSSTTSSSAPGETPRVAAVLDWEMATVGDPRADLGYLLSFWPEPGERPPAGPARHRRRRLPEPRRAGRGVGAGDRPDGRRPHLVRHPRDLEARHPARGVVPPAPGRQHRRPVLRHPRARRARPARPRPGDLRCLT